MEAPGVEPPGHEPVFAESRADPQAEQAARTVETLDGNRQAGASMAHAITRDDLVASLLAAARRLDADAPELAYATRAAAALLAPERPAASLLDGAGPGALPAG